MDYQISESTAGNLTATAINDSYLLNLSAERREELSVRILAEINRPLYVFYGCLGDDGSFRRYTKRVER